MSHQSLQFTEDCAATIIFKHYNTYCTCMISMSCRRSSPCLKRMLIVSLDIEVRSAHLNSSHKGFFFDGMTLHLSTCSLDDRLFQYVLLQILQCICFVLAVNPCITSSGCAMCHMKKSQKTSIKDQFLF